MGEVMGMITANKSHQLLDELKKTTEKRNKITLRIAEQIPLLICNITERISLRQLARRLGRSPTFVCTLRSGLRDVPSSNIEWWMQRLLEINEEVWP
jgi:hypothetical protein